MSNSRNTYININLNNIEYNVKKIINKYKDYKYYIGVVKADAYNHGDIKVVETLIKSGCNYLAVSSIEEAIHIRKKISNNIPILCLENTKINKSYLSKCIRYKVTITLTNLQDLNSIVKHNKKMDLSSLKFHIKIDTGMNRLGFKTKDELSMVIDIFKENNLYIEGIYTHIYKASEKNITENQFKKFEEIISNIDIDKIPIIHIPQSQTLVTYEKKQYINGVRLGIIMYGFNEKNLKSTFSVTSEVIQINNIKKGETVGYDGTYIANENEKIATVCIGYADGITRGYKNSYVYINDKKYNIIGNICMDMIMVKIDDSIKLYDKVVIIRDNQHIKDISSRLNTIPYEVICNISKRVEKIYIH